MLKRNRQKGFTLIELLIVVAIIGIIAAILIPNLIDALQKAKQKRTVADERNIGTAITSWLTDQFGAAAAGSDYNASAFTDTDYAVIAEYLNSSADSTFFYMQATPQFDGWKGDYEFAVNSNLLGGQTFIICSRGRALPDLGVCNSNHTMANLGAFIATDYNQDILFADGFFIKYPGNVAP